MLLTTSSCSHPNLPSPGVSGAVPKITAGTRPERPNIKSETVELNGKAYIAYLTTDGLALFTFLVNQDAYIDQLELALKYANQRLQEVIDRH